MVSLGSREVASQHVAINAVLGKQNGVSRGITSSKSRTPTANFVPATAPDAIQWSPAKNDLMFRKRSQTGSRQMHVLPTTDGVDHTTFNKDYDYAGVAITAAQFDRARDVPIAIKTTGVANILNTGSEHISIGDMVEYSAMDVQEGKSFRQRTKSQRTLPKISPFKFIRRGKANKPSPLVKHIQDTFNRKVPLTASELTELEAVMKRSTSRVIGVAQSIAPPGEVIKVHLKRGGGCI